MHAPPAKPNRHPQVFMRVSFELCYACTGPFLSTLAEHLAASSDGITARPSSLLNSILSDSSATISSLMQEHLSRVDAMVVDTASTAVDELMWDNASWSVKVARKAQAASQGNGSGDASSVYATEVQYPVLLVHYRRCAAALDAQCSPCLLSNTHKG